MIIFNNTIDSIENTIIKDYDNLYTSYTFIDDARKTISKISEKTPTQYYNLSIEEVFYLDNRNTINKLSKRSINILQGLQIGLVQESLRNIGVVTSYSLVNPIKEYNSELTIKDKYDNNIKY